MGKPPHTRESLLRSKEAYVKRTTGKGSGDGRKKEGIGRKKGIPKEPSRQKDYAAL